MSVEAEWRQSVSKKPRQRCSQIHTNYQNPPRTMNPFRQLNQPARFQTRSQYAQTLAIPFETMLHLIGDTSLFLCRGFQHCVRRDVVDEMLAQISRKIREAFVAQSLNC